MDQMLEEPGAQHRRGLPGQDAALDFVCRRIAGRVAAATAQMLVFVVCRERRRRRVVRHVTGTRCWLRHTITIPRAKKLSIFVQIKTSLSNENLFINSTASIT